MNVFSTKDNPKFPYPLTQTLYNKKTSREKPYVWAIGEEVKSYAICPACQNPTTLVNRHIAQTNATILYAKHTGHDVSGLAGHNQAAYLDCPFHNPERFDSKTRRSSTGRNNELREALRNHLHLVITTLEGAIGVRFSDTVVESMVQDFGGNCGYEYKAINLYNLPFGFAYMTEAQDLHGCTVESEIADAINTGSVGFETSRYSSVFRRCGVKGTKLRFYFNNHRLDESSVGKDSIDLVVVEIDVTSNESRILFTKRVDFDCEKFFNTYMRRERFRLLAHRYF
ncbi:MULTISPECIES: hypothetical protein [Pseudomonas]|uniref:hypothetical protein n=1 Tax=Pseudomonas TaxID=286 RepID=UPI001FC9363E|nr:MULTISPECIES: hypothetical protein [Pseudomonas]